MSAESGRIHRGKRATHVRWGHSWRSARNPGTSGWRGWLWGTDCQQEVLTIEWWLEKGSLPEGWKRRPPLYGPRAELNWTR